MEQASRTGSLVSFGRFTGRPGGRLTSGATVIMRPSNPRNLPGTARERDIVNLRLGQQTTSKGLGILIDTSVQWLVAIAEPRLSMQPEHRDVNEVVTL